MKSKIFGRRDFKFELVITSYIVAAFALLCVGVYTISLLRLNLSQAIITGVVALLAFGILAFFYVWRLLKWSEELVEYKRKNRIDRVVEIIRFFPKNAAIYALQLWLTGGILVAILVVVLSNFSLYQAFLVFYGAVVGGITASALVYYFTKNLMSVHFSGDIKAFYDFYKGELSTGESNSFRKKISIMFVALVGVIMVFLTIANYLHAKYALLSNIKSVGVSKLKILAEGSKESLKALEEEGWDFFEINEKGLKENVQIPLALKEVLDKTSEGSGNFIDYSKGNVYLWVKNRGSVRGIFYPWERVNNKELKTILLDALLIIGLSFLIIFAVTWLHTGDITNILKDINNNFSKILKGKGFSEPAVFEVISDDEFQDAINGWVCTINRLKDSLNTVNKLSMGISEKTGFVDEFYHKAMEESNLQVEGLKEAEEKITIITKKMEDLKDNAELSSKSVDEISSSSIEMDANLRGIFEIIGEFMERVSKSIKLMNKVNKEIENFFNFLNEIGKVAEEEVDVISKMETSTSMVQKKIEEVQEKTMEVSDSARVGAGGVAETIKIVREMKIFIKELGDVIEKMMSHSKEIGNILTLIDDLADETNLLSLNASIIAAQAGEHGRAFAVVADQVRELAERTSVSTKDVKRILQDIMSGTSSIKSMVERGSDKIERGVEGVVKIEKDFSNINKNISDSAQLANYLKNFSEEQINDISESLRKLKNFVDSVSQGRKSIEEILENVEKLNESNEFMQSMIEKVINATAEQEKGGKVIYQNIENITEVIKSIEKIVKEEIAEAESLKSFLSRSVDGIVAMFRDFENVHTHISELEKDTDKLLQSLRFTNKKEEE